MRCLPNSSYKENIVMADASGSGKGVSVLWSVCLLLAGMAALFLPTAAGLGVSIVIAWLIVFSGGAHLLFAFSARSVGGVLWRLLLGIVYIVGGVYLLMHPGLNLLSITLVLAFVFFAEGILQLMFFLQMRSRPGAIWMLLDALVTLLLGAVIWRHWPSSSAWAVGTLVGVNLLMSGFTRLMHGNAMARSASVPA